MTALVPGKHPASEGTWAAPPGSTTLELPSSTVLEGHGGEQDVGEAVAPLWRAAWVAGDAAGDGSGCAKQEHEGAQPALRTVGRSGAGCVLSRGSQRGSEGLGISASGPQPLGVPCTGSTCLLALHCLLLQGTVHASSAPGSTAPAGAAGSLWRHLSAQGEQNRCECLGKPLNALFRQFADPEQVPPSMP